MRGRIRLVFEDRVLERAVALILSDCGFDVTREAYGESEIPVITDILGFDGEKGRILYISEGEVTEKREHLHRPFEEAELERAAEELFSEKASNERKNGLKVDKKHSAVTLDGQRITLTEKEMKLFILLWTNKGKAVSDAEIVKNVFGGETVENSNIAAVYVNYLRKKLDEKAGKRLIYRVRGEGYMIK